MRQTGPLPYRTNPGRGALPPVIPSPALVIPSAARDLLPWSALAGADAGEEEGARSRIPLPSMTLSEGTETSPPIALVQNWTVLLRQAK
jgi:hypothetical protein